MGNEKFRLEARPLLLEMPGFCSLSCVCVFVLKMLPMNGFLLRMSF